MADVPHGDQRGAGQPSVGRDFSLQVRGDLGRDVTAGAEERDQRLTVDPRGGGDDVSFVHGDAPDAVGRVDAQRARRPLAHADAERGERVARAEHFGQRGG